MGGSLRAPIGDRAGRIGAPGVLGFGNKANVSIRNATVTPKRPRVGGSVTIAFEVVNKDSRRQRLLVDFRLHFVKANGKTSPKVFKLKTIALAPKETVFLGKTISLAEMTTRKHYPGIHRVEVILNGAARRV